MESLTSLSALICKNLFDRIYDMKNKKVWTALCAVVSLLALSALVPAAAVTVTTGRDFYYNRYVTDKTADTLGMPQSELNRALDDLMRFINEDDRDALDKTYTFDDGQTRTLWTNNEKLWLSDLRDFIRTCITVAIALGVAALAGFAVLLVAKKKEGLVLFGKTYWITATAFAFAVLCFGMWAAIDINGLRLALDGMIFSAGVDFIEEGMALASMFSLKLFHWETVRVLLMLFVYACALSAAVMGLHSLGKGKKEDEDDYLYQ